MSGHDLEAERRPDARVGVAPAGITRTAAMADVRRRVGAWSVVTARSEAAARPAVDASRPVVIVLAAGDSARYRAAGGTQDKLSATLATVNGTRTLIEHVLAAVAASGLPWQVIDRGRTAQAPRQGMGTSIALGVADTAAAGGWLILPADLPLILPQSLQRVAAALSTHAVVVPVVAGVRGHPVGFGPACRDELLALSGDEGARRVAERHRPFLLELDDEGCVRDVDTPQALLEIDALARRLR